MYLVLVSACHLLLVHMNLFVVLTDIYNKFCSGHCSCALLKFNSAPDATKVVNSLKTIRDDLIVHLLQPHERIRKLLYLCSDCGIYVAGLDRQRISNGELG